jgi:hypothetical protein
MKPRGKPLDKMASFLRFRCCQSRNQSAAFIKLRSSSHGRNKFHDYEPADTIKNILISFGDRFRCFDVLSDGERNRCNALCILATRFLNQICISQPHNKSLDEGIFLLISSLKADVAPGDVRVRLISRINFYRSTADKRFSNKSLTHTVGDGQAAYPLRKL